MLRSLIVAVALSLATFAFAQNQPPSDPQAVSYAAKSIAALTGGTGINDATLTGSVTWAGNDTGTATLMALGTGESRMDLVLGSGTRTEIRDAQTGTQLGKWINPDSSSGSYAPQNCWTDAAWFFPVLGSLAAGPNVVLSYIGQETRNGAAVQHIQSYVYQANWPSGVSPSPMQLSTIDFYLDASTLLPVAEIFNSHPDSDASTNLTFEVDFTNYQSVSGEMVPMRIQRFQQGSMLIDFVLSGTSFNSGLSLSNFSIN